jgi:molecular chaperone GrpE
MTEDKGDSAARRHATAGTPPDGEGAPGAGGRDSDLMAKIQGLERALDACEAEVKTNYDRFLRERADLENFKKRAAREREEVARYGIDGLVKALLPSIDNLERAVTHAASGGDGQPLLAGVSLVLKGLRDALEQHGVRPVNAQGQRFDPAVHEAMEQVETSDHEPNVVVREHQRGYMLHDRLLRPALVGVSKRPAEGPQD